MRQRHYRSSVDNIYAFSFGIRQHQAFHLSKNFTVSGIVDSLVVEYFRVCVMYENNVFIARSLEFIMNIANVPNKSVLNLAFGTAPISWKPFNSREPDYFSVLKNLFNHFTTPADRFQLQIVQICDFLVSLIHLFL